MQAEPAASGPSESDSEVATSLPISDTASVPAAPGSIADVAPIEDVVAEPWRPATRTEELAAEVDAAGGVSLQAAIDAIALEFPDMPGATPTPLPPGDGFSASRLASIVEQVRDRLTPEQLAVVAQLEGDGTAGESGEVGSGAAATPISFGFRSSKPATPAQSAALAKYVALTTAAWNDWKAFWPAAPLPGVIVELPTFQVGKRDMDSSPHPADTRKCRIRVFPQVRALTIADGDLKELFAHELVHCMQFVWGSGTLAGIPDWIIEGGAAFGAYHLYRASRSPYDRNLYDAWFVAGAAPLASRSYSAWPLFETFQRLGGDAMDAMRIMVTERQSDVDGALISAGMKDPAFRLLWSSMSLRSSSFLETEWVLPWPGPAPSIGPRDNFAPFGSRGVGTYQVKGLGQYGHPQLLVSIASDVGIMTVSPTSSPMLTHAATGTVSIPERGVRRLCFDEGGCVCPEGSSSDTIPMADRRMLFTFPASLDAPSADVKAVKWDPKEFCSKPAPKQASSNGDPHLVTFDGRAFDVMRPGEFVLTAHRGDVTGSDAASVGDDFEVQTRHLPLPDGGSGTSAVAMRIGGRRVTFTKPDLGSRDVEVRVDGSVVDVDVSAASSVPSAGRAGVVMIETDGEGGWSVTGPTAERVGLRDTIGWFVTVSLDAARASEAVGLLGAGNDNMLDDLVLPGGSTVPLGAPIDDTYAPAWQVTEETTLFDYAPGETVAGFRDAVFQPADASLVDDARPRCREALGAAAATHEVDACAFDLAATGDQSFVDAYSDVVADREESIDDVLDPRVRSPRGSGAAAANGVEGRPTVTLSGEVAPGIGIGPTGSLRAAAGTVLVARALDCNATDDLSLRVTDRATGTATELLVCDPFGLNQALAGPADEVVDREAYAWISGDAEFDVVLSTSASSPRFAEVEVFVDPSPTVVAPGSPIAGRLNGVGDTIVATVDTGAEAVMWPTSGLTVACGRPEFGAPLPGAVGATIVWPLPVCGHASTWPLPPTSGNPITVVLFARTPDPIDVSAGPA